MQRKNVKQTISIFDLVAVISGTAIIGWIISDFFIGMVMVMLILPLLINLFLLLYLFSFFETIFTLIRKGKNGNKIKLIAHGIVVVAILTFTIYHSDLLKSKRILTAVLKDDLYHYRLVLEKMEKWKIKLLVGSTTNLMEYF